MIDGKQLKTKQPTRGMERDGTKKDLEFTIVTGGHEQDLRDAGHCWATTGYESNLRNPNMCGFKTPKNAAPNL